MQFLARSPHRCVVCQAALPRQAPFMRPPALGPQTNYPTCGAAQCRQVVGMRTQMSEPQFHLYLDHQVEALEQQRLLSVRGRARDAAEAQENEAGWAQLRQRYPAELPALETVVPSGPKRLAPLAKGRLQRYEAYLRETIAEAFAERAAGHRAPPPSPPAPPSATAVTPAENPALPPARLAGLMCSVCGGGCCVSGKEHAYLIPGTVHRLLAQDPGLTPQAILDGYLSRLPPRSFTRSCVNHTPQGCSLPREWRSDTCNRWLCDSLKDLDALQQKPPGVQIVRVVKRKQNHWQRKTLDLDNGITALALLSEDGIRRLKP